MISTQHGSDASTARQHWQVLLMGLALALTASPGGHTETSASICDVAECDVAEWRHRLANDRRRRVTGLELSSCGTQGIIDRRAADHTPWRTATKAHADASSAPARSANRIGDAHSPGTLLWGEGWQGRGAEIFFDLLTRLGASDDR